MKKYRHNEMLTLKESQNWNLRLEKCGGTAESQRHSPQPQQKQILNFMVNLGPKTQQPEPRWNTINHYKFQMFSYMLCLIFTFIHRILLTALPRFSVQNLPSSLHQPDIFIPSEIFPDHTQIYFSFSEFLWH